MRFLLVIDHLGAGGAQRQLVNLACGLKRNGRHVEIFVYFPEFDFFRSIVERNSIVIHQCEKSAGFSLKVLRHLASLVKSRDYNFVISYLDRPNIYAELACLVSKKTTLIVSERTNYVDDKSIIWRYTKRILHGLADHVVTNSYAQAAWLMKKWWLRDKVSCIYNGVDTSLFDMPLPVIAQSDTLRLIGIGRIGPEKNIVNLIKALKILVIEKGIDIEINWAGRRDASSRGRHCCDEIDEFLNATPIIKNCWHWLGELTNVPQLLSQHHALILPSLYEGLPNVVCEAFAAGKPVLASDVCDHPLLVENGKRGFVFDPLSPESIAEAIQKFADLGSQESQLVSSNAKKYAQDFLSLEKMIAEYEALFSSLAGN